MSHKTLIVSWRCHYQADIFFLRHHNDITFYQSHYHATWFVTVTIISILVSYYRTEHFLLILLKYIRFLSVSHQETTFCLSQSKYHSLPWSVYITQFLFRQSQHHTISLAIQLMFSRVTPVFRTIHTPSTVSVVQLANVYSAHYHIARWQFAFVYKQPFLQQLPTAVLSRSWGKLVKLNRLKDYRFLQTAILSDYRRICAKNTC